MTDDSTLPPHDPPPDGVARRTVIKGAAAGLAGVWAVPLVTSFTSPASAAGSAGNPNPECRGSGCANFIACNADNPSCICTTTAAGGGFCVDGATGCGSGSGTCRPGNVCDPGEICLVDTCCGEPVCIPVAANATCAPTGGRAAGTTTATRVKAGAGTIGG